MREDSMKIQPVTSRIQRYQKQVQERLEKNMARTSSSNRIHRAAGNPTSMAILDQLEAENASMDMASRNVRDSQSLTSIMDEAINSQGELLNRMRELSVQSANGTLNDGQRATIQNEYSQLQQDFDRVAQTTSFNDQALLQGGLLQTLTGPEANNQTELNLPDTQLNSLGLHASSVDTQVSAQASIDTIDQGFEQLNRARAYVGASDNRYGAIDSHLSSRKISLQSSVATIEDTNYIDDSAHRVIQAMRLKAAIQMQHIDNENKATLLSLQS